MPRGIYERDDLPVREKEGLPQIRTCVYGEVPDEIVIREHDAKMLVSIANGQKTGHFLDQQENRGRLKPYAPGQDVLDLCCCTGGFSVHAALYGAKSVEAVAGPRRQPQLRPGPVSEGRYPADRMNP